MLTLLFLLWNYKTFRYLIAAFAIIAIILGFRACRKQTPAGISPINILPRDDQEQIIVDPGLHSLIIIRPEKTQTFTLPDRPTVIDIHKNGSVTVTSKQYGFEHRFFFGVQASNAFRLGAGMDGYYWKRLDIGVGAADKVGNHVPIVFVKMSYNFWSNLQAGLTYDNTRLAGLSLTVRL